MKRLLCVILFVFLVPVHAADSESKEAPNKEVEAAIKEAATIKPGQTRKDLLKIFSDEEGGVIFRAGGTFWYRKYGYIKVDVDFKAVGKEISPGEGSPDDIIVKISEPYLDYSNNKMH